jgi:hypothetical protein
MLAQALWRPARGPPGKVANRASAKAPNGQAFVMKLVPMTGGFRPNGTRVERRVPQLT